jgi:hypothetical protein
MAVFPLRKTETAPTGFDDDVLADARDALDALDLSAEREQVADLMRDIAHIDKAIADGNARLAKVRNHLAVYSGPDKLAVADMLLAGRKSDDVLTAAGRTEAELAEERTVLMDALRELRRRSDAASRQIEEVRRQAKRRVFDCLQPLIAAIEQDARGAAQQVVESFTMLRAISLLTDRGIEGARLGEKAVSAILGPPGLVARTRYLDVPDDIQALLRRLEEKSGDLRITVHSSVVAPV